MVGTTVISGQPASLRQPRHGLVLPGMVWGSYPMRQEPTRSASRGWSWWTAWMARPRTPGQGETERFVAQVKAEVGRLDSLDEAAVAEALIDLRQRLTMGGLQGKSLCDAVAFMGFAVQRHTGWQVHDVQWLAAWWMLHDHLVEMATGEGKSVALVLAAGAAALAGVPVHLMTANDYLARRDETQWRPVFAQAGLCSAAVVSGAEPVQRKKAYQSHVVYLTAKEAGFDHLRDMLARHESRPEDQVMRGLCMAMVDEADSILLDEATTPLILSRDVLDRESMQTQRMSLYLARMLHAERDFLLDAHQTPQLTPAGRNRLGQACAGMKGPWLVERYRVEQVLRALTALHALHADVHYLVRDDQVQIIDATTGRLAVGRNWSRGLHQMVCLKEGVSPPKETCTLLETSYQRLFSRYHRVCGLSGTLWEDRFDLMATYGLAVSRLAPRLPSQRLDMGVSIMSDRQQQWQRVLDGIRPMVEQGRAVLVGTGSVAESQQLSQWLQQHGVTHQLLNARQDESGGAAERAMIASAGQAAAVTVATHMAGRGTDINVTDAVLQAGGLHVINTHLNASARIDRQLLGRTARQGQPGSSESILCWQSAPLCWWGQSAWRKQVLLHSRWCLCLVLWWQQWLSSNRLSRQRWALLLSQQASQQQTALAGRLD